MILFLKGDLIDCVKKPCLNNAVCVNQPSSFYGYFCICPTFYHGVNCDICELLCFLFEFFYKYFWKNFKDSEIKSENVDEVSIDEVVNLNNEDENLIADKDESGCYNGGIRKSSELPCNCKAGFTGDNCEIIIGYYRGDPCNRFPCGPHGVR